MRLYLFGMVGIAACICMAELPQPEPESQSLRPIGVMGDDAAAFLKAHGFDCVPLPENAWLDDAILTNHPVIVCDTFSYTSNPAYYDSIREYVQAGGVAFLTYCFQSTVGGTYFADSATWGPCLRYAAVADEIANNVPAVVGVDVSLTNAWVDAEFSSYGLLEPMNSRARVLIRGDFINRGNKTDTGAPQSERIVTNVPWLVQNQFGAGFVLNGMKGAFCHANRRGGAALAGTLSNVVRYAASLGKDRLGDLRVVNASPRPWPGMERHSFRQAGQMRTACFVGAHFFFQMDADWLARRLRMFDADRIDVIIDLNRYANMQRLDAEVNAKIQALRKQGIAFSLSFSASSLPLRDRVPGVPARDAFFQSVAVWAPWVDVLGMDEWFFTPSCGLATQGANEQDANVASFRKQFQDESGFSDADVDWAFANSSADDSRARKLWEFSNKLADGFMGEFVRVAKQANPKVRTWISYITHNWNKLVTCLDRAPGEFDELLDCQTYWYGGNADDPLDAAGLLAPIGLGKIVRHEYPDSFLWAGFSPLYAGGRMTRAARFKWWRPSSAWQYGMCYQNTPEEVTPYLALLYASVDGVFIFTVGTGDAPGDGSDLEFADVVRLVSHLVPRIRDYRRSEIGYYYNPSESWELTRQKKSVFYQGQAHLKTLGYLQMFGEVEVTAEPHSHRKLVVAGPAWTPIKKPDERQIYLWGGPWFQADAQPIAAVDWSVLGTTPARLQLDAAMRGAFGAFGEQMSSANRFHLRSIYPDEAGYSVVMQATNAFLLQEAGLARPVRSLKIVEDGVVAAQAPDGVRINTLNASLLTHTTARRLLGNDMQALGWKTRDCPQITGNSNLVAVAFRDAREAVIDFGPENKFGRVSLLVFNGRTGIERAETLPYRPGMTVSLPPYAVLVARGVPKT